MTGTESSDRGELERLRAENAELRRRVGEGGEAARSRGWRAPTAAVLFVLGGLLLAATVPAVWAARTLLDTDRYTETVAPLAQDASIRSSVAVSAVDALFARADVEGQVRSALPTQAAFLTPQLVSGLRTFGVQGAEKVLATPQFTQLWTEANRQAHQRIVGTLLNGTGPRGALGVENGTVTIDLTKVVAQVKAALVSRGLTFVSKVPDTVAGGSVTLAQSSGLAQLQSLLRGLQTLSVALPVLTVLVLGAAIAVAPDRRRALLWLGVTAIVAMLALGVGLALARDAYVSAPPAGILSGTAATAFFDTLVRFLRNAIRTIAAIGLVLLVGAALAGPSSAAVRLRRAVGGGMDSLGLDLGEPAEWTDRHRGALDVVIVVIAGIVLFATNTPTPGLVIGLAIAVLLGFLLVELLAHARPPGGGTLRGQPGI